jgi:hypothetical protein
VQWRFNSILQDFVFTTGNFFKRPARRLRSDSGMSRKARWIATLATGIAAVPGSYAANLMIGASTPVGKLVGALVGAANALALIPI